MRVQHCAIYFVLYIYLHKGKGKVWLTVVEKSVLEDL